MQAQDIHRVWDKDKFVAAQRHQHEVRAEGQDKRAVSLTTEAEYKRVNHK